MSLTHLLPIALLVLSACATEGPVTPEAEITAEAAAPQTPPHNLLILVTDTLRADALGVYGNTLGTSPMLDAYAEDAVVFERAWTQSTYTPGSFVSYMTSTYVRTHGWNYQLYKSETHRSLMPDLTTLAEVLQENGFNTQGVYANRHLSNDLDFDRGFDQWQRAPDEGVVEAAKLTMDEWGDDRNLLYLHLMAPHLPWDPGEAARAHIGVPEHLPAEGLDTQTAKAYVADAPASEVAERIEDVRSLYHACVYEGDAYAGQILSALESSGHAEDTVVVIFSDHGEEFWEHTFSHFHGVWETLAHVPLIIRAPGLEPDRVDDRVASLIDVGPTALALLGLSPPESWQGVDLMTSAPQTSVTQRHSLTALTNLDRKKSSIDTRKDRTVYYDLVADPLETKAIKRDPVMKALFTPIREGWESQTPLFDKSKAGAKLSSAAQDEHIEALKILGYVE